MEAAAEGARKTAAGGMLPAVLSPWRPGGNVNAMPKATPQNLRRFAETPVARRAINVVKDRIAGMDWQVRAKRNAVLDDELQQRLCAARRVLEQPNPQDSFRTLIEPLIEDVIVGGFGAAELELTGDANLPLRLWPVDGATVAMESQWTGDAEQARYVQTPFGAGTGVPLLDRELMYVRLNPRTHTPFGLGRLEVAFETMNQFLAANRFAGKLASNSVAQYALWLDEATPQQHERLIRYWQDEVEGTGQVPILSSPNKPEVLRFSGGTDADLRLQWQEFLLRVVACAFDIPPMLLGIQADVNRSTASEMAEEAFQSAIVPVAKLVAEHITRDAFSKALGWDDVEFVFNDLIVRDAMDDATIQVQLLNAGVLTLDEIRKMRGLAALTDEQKAEEDAKLQMQLLAAGVLTVNEVRKMRGLAPLPPIGNDDTGGVGAAESDGGGVSDGDGSSEPRAV